MKRQCAQRIEIVFTVLPSFRRMAIKYKHSDVYSMYKIANRLELANEIKTLKTLQDALTEQLHDNIF